MLPHESGLFLLRILGGARHASLGAFSPSLCLSLLLEFLLVAGTSRFGVSPLLILATIRSLVGCFVCAACVLEESLGSISQVAITFLVF